MNIADKMNMYMETKPTLTKLMGDLAEGNPRSGLAINLEPGWRKSISSSNRTGHVPRCNSRWVGKEIL